MVGQFRHLQIYSVLQLLPNKSGRNQHIFTGKSAQIRANQKFRARARKIFGVSAETLYICQIRRNNLFDYSNIRKSLEQGSLKQVIETEFGDIETTGTAHTVKINKIGNI